MPKGLRVSLNYLYDRYQIPLFIVENGLGAVDEISDDHQIHDNYRIDYLTQHVREMKKAVDLDGVVQLRTISLIIFSPFKFTSV